MSARYMASGSFDFSPKRNAAVGLVGVTIASTLLKAYILIFGVLLDVIKEEALNSALVEHNLLES